MRDVPPLALASLRAVFGALFLTLAARLLAPEVPRPTAAERWQLAALAFFGVVANQTLFISGLARSTATNAALISATIPVFTLLTALAFRSERLRVRTALGVPLALSGVLFLLDLSRIHLGGPAFVGNVFLVLNSLCYAIYLVGARGLLARRSAISVIAAVFRYGAIPVTLLALPDFQTFTLRSVSGTALLATVGVIVFGTILPYALTAWALARTTASTTAVFIYIQPVLAGALAWAVLDERPGLRVLGAGALIFAGVALASWPARRAVSAGPG